MATNSIPVSFTANMAPFQQQSQKAFAQAANRSIKVPVSMPLGKFSADVRQFERSLDAAVARVVSFTATTKLIYGTANAFKSITNSAIDVEHSMAKISSILGSTANQTRKFQKDLFSLANSTSTNFFEAAEAAEEFARQGLGLNKTLEATKSAMILAKLSGVGLKQTIEGITAVMSTSSDEGLEFIDVANKLAAVDAKFATSGAGLIEGLKRFGGVAKENGLILDESIGLLAALKQITGRSESVLGNSIKSILTSFGSEGAQKALEGIGVSVKDNNEEFKDAVTVGRELALVYGDLSDSQKAFVSQKVAGKYQADAFKGFIRAFQPGKEGKGSLVDQAISTSANSKDEGEGRIAKLNETTKSSLEVLKNNVTEIGASLGERMVKPIIDNIVGTLNQGFKLLSPTLDAEGKKIGFSLGDSIAAGIGNVLSGPGLALGAFVIFKFFAKISKDTVGIIQNLTGVQRIKQNITALDQVAVSQIYPKLEASDLKRIANLTSVQQKEQAILNILNAQVAAANARAFAGSFLGRIPGAVAGGKFKTKASGHLTEAMLREQIDINNGVGGARPGARPKVQRLNVGRGTENVVVNTDEKIVKNYANSGQDAIFNRKMMGYSSGFTPNFASARQQTTSTTSARYRKLLRSQQRRGIQLPALPVNINPTGFAPPPISPQQIRVPAPVRTGPPAPPGARYTPPTLPLPRYPVGASSPFNPVPSGYSQASSGTTDYLRRSREAAERRAAAKQEKAERNQRNSGKFGGIGFGASFVGGFLAENLRGPNGESTLAQRSVATGSNALGVAGLIGSINPVAGALAGVGLGMQTLVSIMADSKVGIDATREAYSKLETTYKKNISGIENYSNAFVALNDLLENGSTRSIESARKNLSESLVQVKDPDIKKRLKAAQNIEEIQDVLEESKVSGERALTRSGANTKLQEYRLDGKFGSRVNDDVFDFAKSNNDKEDGAQIISDAITGSIDFSKLSKEVQDKLIKGTEDINFEDFGDLLPSDSLKQNFTDVRGGRSGTSRFNEGEGGLRGRVTRQLREKGFAETESNKKIEEIKKAPKFVSLIENQINKALEEETKKRNELNAGIESLNKELEFSSKGLSEFGRASVESRIELIKAGSEFGGKQAGLKNSFLTTAGDIFKDKSLNVENTKKATGAISSFIDTGDFEKFRQDIQASLGSGGIKELIELASKNLPLMQENINQLKATQASITEGANRQIQAIKESNAESLYGGGTNAKELRATQAKALKANLARPLENKIATTAFGLTGQAASINSNSFSKRNLGISRGNASRAETSLAGLRAEAEAGLFNLDLPGNASKEQKDAKDAYLASKKKQAVKDFTDLRSNNIREELGSQIPIQVGAINDRFKRSNGTGAPLIPKDQLAKIQQSVANGDLTGAQSQLGKFDAGSSKEAGELLSELKNFVQTRIGISSITGSQAETSANNLIKGDVGERMAAALDSLNTIEGDSRVHLGNLDNYFASQRTNALASIAGADLEAEFKKGRDLRQELGSIPDAESALTGADLRHNLLKKLNGDYSPDSDLSSKVSSLSQKPYYNSLFKDGKYSPKEKLKDFDKQINESDSKTNALLASLASLVGELNTTAKTSATKSNETSKDSTQKATAEIGVTVQWTDFINSPELEKNFGEAANKALADYHKNNHGGNPKTPPSTSFK